MKLTRSQATITEREDGWNLGLDDREEIAFFPTAAEALRFLQDTGALAARCGVSNIITIIWEPKTAIGRQVVRVLTNQEVVTLTKKKER